MAWIERVQRSGILGFSEPQSLQTVSDAIISAIFYITDVEQTPALPQQYSCKFLQVRSSPPDPASTLRCSREKRFEPVLPIAHLMGIQARTAVTIDAGEEYCNVIWTKELIFL
ncbi:hypothetical protein KSP39_PZI006920 [Platanthera zijinensis]|uniref:Uncharacterized protein n=1 Tax=Platanthera zijinensis TaxID=2320716 RepID=A0AAP0G9S2_9ASPA